MLITSCKIASCAELDGSVSGSDFTEANDGVRVLVGAPVSIISTRPKNLAAIQAGNRQVPEQAHKRASVPDQGQVHVKWLIVFENGKTTHFQNGS